MYCSWPCRHDVAPVPLPPIKSPKRAVLVRHGQSTWNAAGRVQGSSNLAVLTSKGIAQAETTHELVRSPYCSQILVFKGAPAAQVRAFFALHGGLWDCSSGAMLALPAGISACIICQITPARLGSHGFVDTTAAVRCCLSQACLGCRVIWRLSHCMTLSCSR